jgi:hypothetical protein
MRITPLHKEGQKAKVEIYNQKIEMNEWHECEIIGLQSALDREYRVNVRLESGLEIFGCAPECVIMTPTN